MEKYNNLFPSSNIESSRDHYSLYHSRDFYKGKSFNFAGNWAPGVHYFNDEYITDFVAYEGALLACDRSHLSSSDSAPKLLYNDIEDPNHQRPIGVDSPFWDFVFSGTPGMRGDSGQVYVPEYDESSGTISWVLTDSPQELEDIRVKGDKGDKGDKGNGIKSITLSEEGEEANTYKVLYDNGESSFISIPNGKNGADGADGKDGKAGRGISSISGPVRAGLTDTYTMHYSDGTTSIFTVTNGANGSDGQDGRDGRDGRDGQDGKSATISVSPNTITGAPGSYATVINVGTPSEAVLQFTIPRGEKGEKGDTGKGEKGEQGEQGPEGKRIKLYRDFSDDTIKWGYDGEPVSEWTVLCYMEYLRGVSITDVDITDDAHLEITLSSGHYTYNVDEEGNPIKDEHGNIIYDKWVPDIIKTEGKAAATLTAGKLEIIEPLDPPRIENVGTIKDPIWDFYIPRGHTGKSGVHVGPEDPVTYRNNHSDDPNIQELYKDAEDMIWVDTTEDADFDHINSVYHGYKEAGGQLPFDAFKEVFSKLSYSGGLEIIIKESFEALGEPGADKLNKIWLVPSTNPGSNDLYQEYICVLKDEEYVWELWGSGSAQIDLDNYYTKDEVDSLLQDVSSTIWIPL